MRGLFPLAHFVIQIEKMPRHIPDGFYLCEDLAHMLLFFHLLFHKPLEHFKRRMVFLFDCQFDKRVDKTCNLLLVGIYFLENLAG